jgi:hypothetical protein
MSPHSQEFWIVFEIIAVKFMPHFEGENCEINWERQLRKILPYTLDNVMHSVHWGQEWSIKDVIVAIKIDIPLYFR